MRRIILIIGFMFVYGEAVAFAASSSRSGLLSKQADEYYALGLRDAGIGNLGEAMKYYQKAVAMNPSLAQAHYGLAKIYQAKGWIERAEESYRRASRLNPNLSIPQSIIYQEERTMPDYSTEKEGILREARAWAKEIESEIGNITPGINRYPAARERIARGPVSVTYLGTTKTDTYPAERKGHTVSTILDPYHPKHEGFKIPYIKDRQGLKLTRYIGVGASYEYEQEFPLNVSILEAKQFAQSGKEQIRAYISPSETQFKEFQINLFYKEDWPKLRYTYRMEDARRQYNAKKLWSDNDLWSQNQDYHDLLLKYTFTGLPHIGYLIVEPGYRWAKITSDNDPHAEGNENRYHLALTTALLDDLELFLEYNNSNRKKNNPARMYNSTFDKIEEYNYTVELRKNFPAAKFKVIPSYYYSKEEWIFKGDPKDNWIEHRFRLKTEKQFNPKLEWNSESNWNFLERERPEKPYNLRARYLGTEHWLLYKLFGDFKTGPYVGYYTGIDSNNFDYWTAGWDARLNKTGLINLSLAYRYLDFYRIDDRLNLLLFRLSLFM